MKKRKSVCSHQSKQRRTLLNLNNQIKANISINKKKIIYIFISQNQTNTYGTKNPFPTSFMKKNSVTKTLSLSLIQDTKPISHFNRVEKMARKREQLLKISLSPKKQNRFRTSTQKRKQEENEPNHWNLSLIINKHKTHFPPINTKEKKPIKENHAPTISPGNRDRPRRNELILCGAVLTVHVVNSSTHSRRRAHLKNCRSLSHLLQRAFHQISSPSLPTTRRRQTITVTLFCFKWENRVVLLLKPRNHEEQEKLLPPTPLFIFEFLVLRTMWKTTTHFIKSNQMQMR